MMNSKKPRILLIGAGAFGTKHLNTLLDLERKGVLELAGVVVNTKKTEQLLRKTYTSTPIHYPFSEKLLDGIDAVDIVTPVETHFDLIQRCLPKVHVFVEKPVTASSAEAEILKKMAGTKKILMAGHIFRFHPVVHELRDVVGDMVNDTVFIEGGFLNPAPTDNGRDVELEMLHMYDIIDYVFGKRPISKHVEDHGRHKVVSLVYSPRMRAVFKLGWKGADRVRKLKLTFRSHIVHCDLDKNALHLTQHGRVLKKLEFGDAMMPLEAELRKFVDAVLRKTRSYPDITVGHRIVDIATMGRDAVKEIKKKKKVAVIGGGIFGTNCAIELGPHMDVTLYDKNKGILSEASYINQYRHHWGYHYPRSQETVADIRHAITDFEERYKESIVTSFPTYYSVAKEDSKITASQFLEFCDKNNLPYTIEEPGEGFLAKDKIELCLKTFEPIYNYHTMRDITLQKLKESGTKVKLGHEVIDARILPDGRKELTIRKGKEIKKEVFDYVINVTYARYNNFCKWLGFLKKPLRLEIVEVLWVKLKNAPKISLAVMDGQFTNIVPTSTDNLFTLVHIEESVLKEIVPRDGLVPSHMTFPEEGKRVDKIIKKSMEWFPFVKDAKVLKVHHVLRGVNAYREYDDARISEITEHGHGCYSILGGKIINSVTIAKQVAKTILGR